MKIQTSGAECPAADREQLVPPVGRRQRRVMFSNWQAALQAITLFIGLTSLTLSSIVFMVLLYTPASSPLTQARDMNDLREVVDMQRQLIGRLQREDNYQDARQKAFQSALAAAGLITDDVRAQLEGIERALMGKGQEEVVADIDDLVALGAKNDESSLIGRPDGHEMHSDSLIGRHAKSLVERLFQNVRDNSESQEDESHEDMIA